MRVFEVGMGGLRLGWVFEVGMRGSEVGLGVLRMG